MATSTHGEGEKSPQDSISITVSSDYGKVNLSEIYSTFCALINTRGGLVTLLLESGKNTDAKNLERRICQKFASILGISAMRDAINLISLSPHEMIFQVQGMTQLCILQYNIYTPTELQTLPLQSAKEVKAILRPKRFIELDDMIKANDYHKGLVSGKPLTDDPVCLESKTMQVKWLKDKNAKRTTLGDRMTSQDNKFASYVSAFANHRGGHVYFGVDDNIIVRGEYVEKIKDIIRKVCKAINNLTWPSDNGAESNKPQRGQHWEIFFEPVKDENGATINKTFVIVIYISYCSGGVFTTEPESYHIVDKKADRKVVRIPFKEWKELVFRSASHIHSIARSDFRTSRSENDYYINMEKMMDLRNRNDENKLKQYITYIKLKYPTVDVQLSTLSQEATCAFRLGEYEVAEELIQKYDSIHAQCEENMLVPGSMGLYIKSAKNRAEGKYQESFELAKCGLQMALEGLTPGLIQAWFCTHTAMVANILANKETDSERHNELIMEAKCWLGIALECSNHVKAAGKFIKAVVDLQQKVYIHLSTLYLGLSLDGSLTKIVYISVKDVSSAKKCLHMVEKLEKGGHKLSPMRKVQYLLALSALHYRKFQHGVSDVVSPQNDNLKQSLDEALELASTNEFKEMFRYCHARTKKVDW